MFAILSLLAVAPAEAYVYWGNPEFKLEISRTEGDLIGGQVDLIGVRIYKCGGGFNDYIADATIDPTDGWTTTITGGNLCGARVFWGSDGTVWSNAFTLKSDVDRSDVPLTGTTSSAAWEDWVVASGSFSGSSPVVKVTID